MKAVIFSTEESMAAWEEFAELWQLPCECCGMEFPWRDAEMGCRVWISLVGKGEISPSNIKKVMDGLKRWRSSKDWHERGGKFTMSVSAFLGYSRNGMPSAPRWSDRPTKKEVYD